MLYLLRLQKLLLSFEEIFCHCLFHRELRGVHSIYLYGFTFKSQNVRRLGKHKV